MRTTTTLLIALLAAATASYAVYRAGNSRTSGPSAATSPILAAARGLEIGTIIKESDLKTSRWVGTPPKGAALKKNSVIGRGVVSPIYEGEPILDSRLAAPGAGGGLAATIPPGMRACAVKVDEVVGVAGFAVSGMRVDVLVLMARSGNGGGTRVKTVLQNIEVLSAGTNFQRDVEGKPVNVQVINLLVSPEQAEILSLASNERIQLVLRNPLDRQLAQTNGHALGSLFGDAPVRLAAPPAPKPARVRQPEAPHEPAPQQHVVEVVNGSKRTEVKLPPAKEILP